MAQLKHPIVVIGAGFSGITATKTCLEEGLSVICLEKSDTIGGLWKYRENVIEGQASVMRSTIIDTSKEMGAFSDFPPPKEFANYMHHSNVFKYLEMYAEHFKVYPHIRYNHEVVLVSESPNYEKTGEWTVKIKNNKTNEESEITASGIMVCIGHHVYPYSPKFPGLAEFEGQVIHSHSYKDFHGYENKSVVVVGIGNSGLDVAVELSRVCSKVYHSTRRGAWIAPRVGPNGIPLDLLMNSRVTHFAMSKLPSSTVDNYLMKRLNERFDHAKFSLRPKHGPRSQHVTVSDEHPSRVLAGAVTVKGDVERFTNKNIIFQGEESEEYPVDAVIFCTGYDYKFPFLPENTLPIHENRTRLYKLVFPCHLKHQTLAIIGFVQPQGSVFPMSEIQSRWVTKVFKHELQLPNKDAMEYDWAKFQLSIDNRYLQTQRHTIEVQHVPYMDSIAELIGAKPNLWKMMVSDPELWWRCFYGPCLPYQYRLEGPNTWPGARNAIMTVWHRVFGALDTRKPKQVFPKKDDGGGILGFFGFLFLMYMVWYLAFYGLDFS